MKIALFSTIALSAIVGMALADDMFNNWNNNNDWNNNDDGRFGGIVGGGFSGGMGSISGMGSMGGGYGSMGYGSSYGSAGGVGYGSGYGAGYGGVQAQYVPVPATGSSGSGIGSFLPLFALLFIFPLLFQSSTSQDQIILLNTTLEG